MSWVCDRCQGRGKVRFAAPEGKPFPEGTCPICYGLGTLAAKPLKVQEKSYPEYGAIYVHSRTLTFDQLLQLLPEKEINDGGSQED